MLNALTIDVEDYFHVTAFERHVRRDEWGSYELRVAANTRRILDMLDEFGIKATFFVLGWVAEREPALVKEIALRGHEVASHGYGHQRVNTRSRGEFRDDIRRSKALLEDLAGAPVFGYRAPSYSISLDTLWAYDELLDAGYTYDSSVFPVRHDLYGIPHWPRFPFCVMKDSNGEWKPFESSAIPESNLYPLTANRLVVIPITTLSLLGKNIPIAGGGYFRLFPGFFTRWGLRRINRCEGKAFVFYLHPWELDPGQPRIGNAGLKSRFRHYVNLGRTEARFRSLLEKFSFGPLVRMACDGAAVSTVCAGSAVSV
jgi:polysaccharide deacetylase family protein (PEP-CTERM system associated)